MAEFDTGYWAEACAAFLQRQPPAPDAAHDAGHVRRVVRTALRLAEAEGADVRVVLPAAYLHDCVAVAKDAPERAAASRRSAAAAVRFLEASGYPAALLPAVAHAIEAHSHSAGIAPETLEARVVQDADRLDALGAVGIARAFLVGGRLGLAFAHPDEPFPATRTPDDQTYALDHLFTKLLGLAATMQTDAGRREARHRTDVLTGFLATLQTELEEA